MDTKIVLYGKMPRCIQWRTQGASFRIQFTRIMLTALYFYDYVIQHAMFLWPPPCHSASEVVNAED